VPFIEWRAPPGVSEAEKIRRAMEYADILPACVVGVHHSNVRSIVWYCFQNCALGDKGTAEVLKAWSNRIGLSLPDVEFEQAIGRFKEYIEHIGKPKRVELGVKRAGGGEMNAELPGPAPVAPERVSPPYSPMPPACAIAVPHPLAAISSQQVASPDSASLETSLTLTPPAAEECERNAADGTSESRVRSERAAREVKEALDRLLGQLGIHLNKAGLHHYAGYDLADAGFRFIVEEKQWVCFNSATGCFVNAGSAQVTGAFAEWCRSSPFTELHGRLIKLPEVFHSLHLLGALNAKFYAVEHTLTNDLQWRGAALRELAGHPALLTKTAGYDADPEILNCPNGYVNLRTRTFTPRTGPGGPLFRMAVDAVYDPTAKCPLWLWYLNEAHPGDNQRASRDRVIPFLQYAGGTALIGRVPPYRSAFWIHGQSTTGKSIFSNVLRRVCGSYAMLVHVTLLMRSGSESRMASALAGLPGKRLACVNEVPDGVVDDVTFKALTSADGESVMALYREAQTVWFSHSLLCTTNHRPVINDSGNAVFTRLRPIPFTHRVARPDPDLEAKLLAEGPGILNWALEGAFRVLNESGLYAEPPAIIRGGVEEYRIEMDVIAAFVAECCDVGVLRATATDSLFAVFSLWCKLNNQLTRVTRRKFLNMLEEGGYTIGRFGSSRDESNTRFRGIAYLGISSEYESLLREREKLDVKWMSIFPPSGILPAVPLY